MKACTQSNLLVFYPFVPSFACIPTCPRSFQCRDIDTLSHRLRGAFFVALYFKQCQCILTTNTEILLYHHSTA